MKRFLKRISTFFVLAVAVAAVLVLGTQTETKAAEKEPYFYDDNYEFMFSPEWDTFGLCIENLAKNAKVTVKVSNKKLGTVEWDKEEKVAWVTAKKPCSFKVTFKVVQNGKTYKHTTKMKWNKYTNPLKSLKIGSKKYDVKYFNGNTSAGMTKVSGNSKVQVKLKSGYKLVGMTFARGGKYKNVKNGSKVNFTKTGDENTVLFIDYKDKKGKYGTLRLFVWDKNETM